VLLVAGTQIADGAWAYYGTLSHNPPSNPVRLIFIHHSTGENWLADDNGALGIALRDNNYFVSDTNYVWGPGSIGDYTDIGDWWLWFRGPNSGTYLGALYVEGDQHASYSRLATNPGGENEIVMFKSCFPNSALQGNPSDPVPPIDSNLLRGEGSGSEYHTVANAKGIYIDLLNYFRTRQDKLFIIITAPPLSDPTYSSNARAFNQWLFNDWLQNYPYHNVFVFDFYDILTTNGGDPSTNDLNQETDNHHRWWHAALQHKTDGDDDADPNVLEYPSSSSDDHPSQAGNLKATTEFIPLLNIAYNQWRAKTTFSSSIRMTTNTGNSEYPSVAAGGSYVYVAWSDSTPVSGSGGSYEIWMRISSNSGTSFGSAIRMSTNTGSSAYPSVAASGSYVYVAWQDSTLVSGSGGRPEIWMRVSSNYGASFGSAIRMSTNAGNSYNPSVAADGSHVYVAWQDDTPVTGSGAGYEVWMRASSNNGATFNSPIRISTNTYDSVSPSVGASGSYVYVAWEDYTPVTGSGAQPEIWMRVSGNSGASFGSAIRLSSNAYMSLYPCVAASGSYVYVAWQDHTPVVGSGGAPEVWMRVSSNNGASFGSAVRMSTNTGYSDYPRLAAAGSGVYVTWQDDTPVTGSGDDFEVWLRASANNGGTFGSPIRITTNTGSSVYPSVAAYGSYVYVAWEDSTPVSGSGSEAEIWLKNVS
jgi:hypothetical protein